MIASEAMAERKPGYPTSVTGAPPRRPRYGGRWPWAGRYLVGLVLGLAGLVASQRPALAHAYPIRIVPSPNAILASSPATVDLWFSERLEPTLSSLAVYDVDRRPVQAAPGQVDPADPTHLTATLRPNLPGGTYTVVWQVVSADDGHPTAGIYAFGIGIAPSTPSVTPASLALAGSRQTSLLGPLGRWLIDLGIVTLLGAASLGLLIRWRPANLPELLARQRVVLIGALLVLLVGQILRLADEAAFTNAGPLGASLLTLIRSTRFGALWLIRLALLGLGGALVVGEMLLERRATIGRDRIDRLAPDHPSPDPGNDPGRLATAPLGFGVGYLIVGLGLVTDLSWSGHAAAGNLLAYLSLAQQTLGWLVRDDLVRLVAFWIVRTARLAILALDWLHLVAVSAWIGGVITLAAIFSGQLNKVDRAARLSPVVQRFSRLAAASALVVLLTGLYNTWLYLGSPRAYLASSYGHGLLLKHLAFLLLLVVAALNHWITVPTLAGATLPDHRASPVDPFVHPAPGHSEQAAPKTSGAGAQPPSLSPGPGIGAGLRGIVGQHPAALLWIEATLGVAVLLSTGLLTSFPPARTPFDILLDPTREQALGTEPFQARLILSDGQTAQLEVSPGRIGLNEYSVTIDRGSARQDSIRQVYLQLTPLDLPGSPVATLALTPAGTDRFTGQGLELSGRGLWQIALRLDHQDGSITTARTTLQVTEEWSAAADPAAKGLLARAATATSRLAAVRLVDALSDGAGALIIDVYTFQAPDRQRIVALSGPEVIQIGSEVFRRDAPGTPWRVERGATPIRWPVDAYSYLRQGVGGIVVGQGVVSGHACAIVAFYLPATQAIYEEWIGSQDGLIYQEIMAGPAHFMINRYDYGSPEPIEPPIIR